MLTCWRVPSTAGCFLPAYQILPLNSHICMGSPSIPTLPWVGSEASLCHSSSFLWCGFDLKVPRSIGTGSVEPGRRAWSIRGRGSCCIMDPQKLWKARALWQHCWALRLRPRLTSLGLELRSAVIPLKDDSHTGQGLSGCRRSPVLP